MLDIGCGPGFLCKDIADAVGSDGAVTGIDISRDLIAICQRRNPRTWLSYPVKDATHIDCPDASFVVVACIQVVECVPDVSRILCEAYRVLQPTGVLCSWPRIGMPSSSIQKNRDRMVKVMAFWKSHCANPHLPRSLSSRLISAGLRPDRDRFSILNLQRHDETYGKGLAGLIPEPWGAGTTFHPMNEWYDEIAQLSGTGRYVFSSGRYIFRASKPSK
jgi:arsenite methyltransferase